ncbi:hypothetical protein [Streptomyces sp. NPDC051677]|uniref:hypothetical protein n=1 Tax=Streptomyces sp. NPDC051677 TaxID=3365669 RepID=UPI0037D79A53
MRRAALAQPLAHQQRGGERGGRPQYRAASGARAASSAAAQIEPRTSRPLRTATTSRSGVSPSAGRWMTSSEVHSARSSPLRRSSATRQSGTRPPRITARRSGSAPGPVAEWARTRNRVSSMVIDPFTCAATRAARTAREGAAAGPRSASASSPSPARA